MNHARASGEILDFKEEVWNNRHFTSFVVDTKKQYKDKATGEMKSWSTRLKCTYEHPNFALNVGDYVYVEGSINNRSIESQKGKVWVTEIKCEDVQVLKSVKPRSTNYGPAPMTTEEIPF